MIEDGRPKALTRSGLGGIWVGLPTPWDAAGRLDSEAFEESVVRAASWGVAGIYSTGTTGEWFALDEDEFAALMDALARGRRRAALAGHDVPLQAGVNASGLRPLLRRAEVALVRGVDALQLALPNWVVPNDDEAVRMFEAIAAAFPGVPLVHYNVARAGRFLDGGAYARIAAAVPELIGAKVTGSDDELWRSLRQEAPDLGFLVGETLLPRRFPDGARGSCSSYIYYAPALTMRLWTSVRDGDDDATAAVLARFRAFEQEAIVPLVKDGYFDAAIDKCFAAAAGHLPVDASVRTPYRSVPPERVQAMARLIRSSYPDFLKTPQPTPSA